MKIVVNSKQRNRDDYKILQQREIDLKQSLKNITIFHNRFFPKLRSSAKLQSLLNSKKTNMQNLPIPAQLHLHHRNSSILSHSAQQSIINQKQPQNSVLLIGKPHKKKYKKKQKPLTQEQIEVFRQAFQIFDSNHSGSIDESQLKSLMNALGYDYSDDQIKKILEEIDEDGSGVIEINEFVEFMSKNMLDTENIKKQIRKVFQHFDDDGAGYLDFRKVKTMVSQCFFNLDDDAVTNMIKAADTEGDMKISEYEFFRIMKKVKLI